MVIKLILIGLILAFLSTERSFHLSFSHWRWRLNALFNWHMLSIVKIFDHFLLAGTECVRKGMADKSAVKEYAARNIY